MVRAQNTPHLRPRVHYTLYLPSTMGSFPLRVCARTRNENVVTVTINMPSYSPRVCSLCTYVCMCVCHALYNIIYRERGSGILLWMNNNRYMRHITRVLQIERHRLQTWIHLIHSGELAMQKQNFYSQIEARNDVIVFNIIIIVRCAPMRMLFV